MTKQLKLLNALRENSREKLTSISKRTNIPISTLFDMLKEMKGTIIQRSTILLNFEELGYNTRAKVFLKVTEENKEKLQKQLELNPNVNTIFKINNGWNFLIETVHKNNRELDQYLEKLTKEYGIVQKEIHYLISEIKREGFVIS